MQSIIKPKPKIRNKFPEKRNFTEQPLTIGNIMARKTKYIKKIIAAVILEIFGKKYGLSKSH